MLRKGTNTILNNLYGNITYLGKKKANVSHKKILVHYVFVVCLHSKAVIFMLSKQYELNENRG